MFCRMFLYKGPRINTKVTFSLIQENIKEAQIVIDDAMGVMVKKFDMTIRGGNISFYPAASKGIFTYSIIADGRLINTKKITGNHTLNSNW